MIRSLVNIYVSRVGIVLTFFTFTLLYNNITLAQQKAITYNSITTEEGLIDDVTITVLQDNNGFMWIGTRAGLVRFDGKNLKNYSYDPDNPYPLS